MKKEKPKKQVVQTFKLSHNEQKMLRYSAMEQRLSVSEYIRNSLLINNPNHEK
jgi:hypothetical protein